MYDGRYVYVVGIYVHGCACVWWWRKQECEPFIIIISILSYQYVNSVYTYVRSVKSNVQGRAFPNRATRERLAVGRMM